MTEVAIRWYRPGDEHAILQTFNLVFREVCGPGYVDRTLEQWRWAFLQNPAGHRISLAVAADGTIASQYAGMPMFCDTPWGERRFVHCVDSMTHPAYRSGLKTKSLFVETCMPFWAHCREIGDALFYGFPVDAAFRIGQRYLKYVMMTVIDYLIRPAAAGPLPMPPGLEVAAVEVVPPDLGGLYEQVRALKRCLVRRDYRYMLWRYRQNPARADYELWTARRGGRLVGLMVLKPGSGLAPDAATIVDWLVPEHDAAAADALLAAAVRRQQDGGKQRLMTVLPPWSHEARVLQQRGFEWTPSANWLQRRLVHNICIPQVTPEFLAEHWWYTLGDTDLA
jgi:Acetyltransferase (GNAT) domain